MRYLVSWKSRLTGDRITVEVEGLDGAVALANAAATLRNARYSLDRLDGEFIVEHVRRAAQ